MKTRGGVFVDTQKPWLSSKRFKKVRRMMCTVRRKIYVIRMGAYECIMFVLSKAIVIQDRYVFRYPWSRLDFPVILAWSKVCLCRTLRFREPGLGEGGASTSGTSGVCDGKTFQAFWSQSLLALIGTLESRYRMCLQINSPKHTVYVKIDGQT